MPALWWTPSAQVNLFEGGTVICGTCGADIERRSAPWSPRYVCPKGCGQWAVGRVDAIVAGWIGVVVLWPWPTGPMLYPGRPPPVENAGSGPPPDSWKELR